jgi:hypothetical protein
MNRLFAAALALVLALPAFAATTWTYPAQSNGLRAAKAACTTGSEAAPADPVKAFDSVTLNAIAAGDTFVITGGYPSPVTFTAHATLDTGRYFKIGANDGATATALAAAINRANLPVSAEAQLAQMIVTGRGYGTAYNGIALNYTGGFACDADCLLSGGVDAVGLDLAGLKGFAVFVEAGAAMTAGGKLVAYSLNPATMAYAPVPELDVTVAALVREGFAGFSLASDFGRIAYVPSGTGQASSVYLVGK